AGAAVARRHQTKAAERAVTNRGRARGRLHGRRIDDVRIRRLEQVLLQIAASGQAGRRHEGGSGGALAGDNMSHGLIAPDWKPRWRRKMKYGGGAKVWNADGESPPSPTATSLSGSVPR